MAANCCPSCGRAYKQSRKQIAQPHNGPIDTSLMGDAELRAYYAATAPIEDTKSFIANGQVSAGLRQAAQSLLHTLEQQGGKHSAITKRAYKLLHQLWREQNIDRATTIEIPKIVPDSFVMADEYADVANF